MFRNPHPQPKAGARMTQTPKIPPDLRHRFPQLRRNLLKQKRFQSHETGGIRLTRLRHRLRHLAGQASACGPDSSGPPAEGRSYQSALDLHICTWLCPLISINCNQDSHLPQPRVFPVTRIANLFLLILFEFMEKIENSNKLGCYKGVEEEVTSSVFTTLRIQGCREH